MYAWRKLGVRALVMLMLVVGFEGENLGISLGGTPFFWSVVLSLGLLASTFGIDLDAMRACDWRVVAKAVTVGVIVKAALISGSIALASVNPAFLLLGLVFAQMDPLAMVALMSGRRMSVRAENLSRAVSSLDDPVTVLLTILVVFAQGVFGFDLGVDLAVGSVATVGDYGKYMWLNIAFMTFVVFMWQLAYKGSQVWRLAFSLVVLAGSILVGAAWYWMFGIALIGIYLRPDGVVYVKINTVLEGAAKVAFAITGVIAGSELYVAWNGGGAFEYALWGAATGALAFLSQMIVGPLMMLGGDYTRQDRWYFACAHQNGLTALILGVSLGLVPVVVPGILMTHVLHAISTKVLDRRYKSNL